MLRILTARKYFGNIRITGDIWWSVYRLMKIESTNDESMAIALNRWFDFDEKPGLMCVY